MAAPQASLVIDAPSAIQDLCITESYIVAQTVDGIIAILDAQCQHDALSKDEPAECTHRRFLDVGKNWGITCAGDTMAVAGDDTIVGLWGLATGSQIATLSGHTDAVLSVRFCKPGTLASGSRDHTIRIWDIESGTCLSVLTGHTGAIHCLRIHNDLLVSGSADTTAKIWSVSTGQCLHTLGGHPSYVTIAEFNDSYTLLATGSGGGLIKIWSVENGACTAICEGHTKVVTQLTSQGELLVSCAADGTIRKWDWSSGQAISAIEAHTGAVRGIAWIDNRMLSAGVEGIVKSWTGDNKQEVSDLLEPTLVIWQFRAEYGKLVCVAKIREGQQCITVWDSSRLKHKN